MAEPCSGTTSASWEYWRRRQRSAVADLHCQGLIRASRMDFGARARAAVHCVLLSSVYIYTLGFLPMARVNVFDIC